MKKIKKTDLKKPFSERIVYDANEILNDLGDYKYTLVRFGNIYSDWRDTLATKLMAISPEHYSQERVLNPQGHNRMGKIIVTKGNDKAIDVAHVYTRYYATDKDSEKFISDSMIMEDLLLNEEFMKGNKEIILIEKHPEFEYEWINELEEKFKVKFVGVV